MGFEDGAVGSIPSRAVTVFACLDLLLLEAGFTNIIWSSFW